jgi:hypothetical protein
MHFVCSKATPMSCWCGMPWVIVVDSWSSKRSADLCGTGTFQRTRDEDVARRSSVFLQAGIAVRIALAMMRISGSDGSGQQLTLHRAMEWFCRSA